MISAILTFLGGGAFRMIWGEVSSFLNKRQEHRIELDRMRLQGELDAATHARNLEAIRVQAELGVKTIREQADADQARIDAEAFREAMARANVPTGIRWVDAWNAVVRPAFATLVLVLWYLALNRQGWTLNDWDMSLAASIIGFFFADRALRKRGK